MSTSTTALLVPASHGVLDNHCCQSCDESCSPFEPSPLAQNYNKYVIYHLEVRQPLQQIVVTFSGNRLDSLIALLAFLACALGRNFRKVSITMPPFTKDEQKIIGIIYVHFVSYGYLVTLDIRHLPIVIRSLRAPSRGTITRWQ